MLRQNMSGALDHDPHFEWRGKDVTRIENLSDIVFAIAFGMLVMSGDPPQTFGDLNRFLINVIPVAFGFIVMFAIWHGHYTFFRRYALADRTVVFLNSLLLLVVLVIAYPLRFIFEALYGFILMQFDDFSVVDRAQITFERSGIIVGYFTAGFGVTQLIFASMYAYALRRAELIGLSATERTLTWQVIWIYLLGATLCGVACALAVLTPMNGFAGFIMNLNIPGNRIVRSLTTPKPVSGPSLQQRQTPGAS